MTTPATTTPAFRLNMSPSSTRLIGTTREKYTGHVLITDAGSAPLKIEMSAEQLTRCVTGKTPGWLTVSGPAKFTLQPGHSRTVAFQVRSAPNTTGSAAVVATGTPVNPGHGAAQLSASIGSRVTLGTTSRCHASPITLPAASHSGAGGTPWLLILLAVVLFASGIVAAVTLARRRRHAI